MIRRTRKSRRRSDGEEVPVSSFSDIAFLLIIFFILATTLQKQTGFTSDLPAGEKSEQPAEKTTTVNLKDRNILLNDKPVDIAQLKARLAEMELADKADPQDRVILLEASGAVDWQNYFQVMSSINDAGGVVAIVRELSEGES